MESKAVFENYKSTKNHQEFANKIQECKNKIDLKVKHQKKSFTKQRRY